MRMLHNTYVAAFKLTSLEVGSQLHLREVHAVAPDSNRNCAALIKHDNTAATCEHASPNLYSKFNYNVCVCGGGGYLPSHTIAVSSDDFSILSTHNPWHKGSGCHSLRMLHL